MLCTIDEQASLPSALQIFFPSDRKYFFENSLKLSEILKTEVSKVSAVMKILEI